jgi:hypothetical protein
MIAVLTADLIDSSLYGKKALAVIIKSLKTEFDLITNESNQQAHFSLFRGDSFQGIIKDPAQALTIALRLKATVAKAQLDDSKSKAMMPLGDVRIAIGIGEGEYAPNDIHTSNGEAFKLSGQSLDGMKKQQKKMSFKSSNNELNQEFLVSFAFLDSATDRWSVASSEVIYYLLKGLKEQQIADVLERSQAAINLRKKAASWDEIKLLLKRFNTVINTFKNDR